MLGWGWLGKTLSLGFENVPVKLDCEDCTVTAVLLLLITFEVTNFTCSLS